MTLKKRFLLKPLAASLLILSASSAMAFTDADTDGMDDQWELWWVLNPSDPADAAFDNDGDTLSNLQEFTSGLLPTVMDSDGDGVNDNIDMFPTDIHHATDNDADGMPDGWEFAHGLSTFSNNAAMDVDADTLTNLQEFIAGTDPQSTDSDHDGVNDNLDAWPVKRAYSLDTDSDGLPDAYEMVNAPLDKYYPSDASADFDGDTLTNLQEFTKGSNPNNPNTDDDGLPDNIDKWPANAAYTYDNDNDELPDAWEAQYGLNSSYPNDAQIPFLGDTDFLSPLQEFTLGTDPNSSDTDNDSYDDRHDFNPLVVHMNDEDLDFDGIPRWWEQPFFMSDSNADDAFNDMDSDGTTSLQEYLNGTYPDIVQDQDNDYDGMLDGWEHAHGLNTSYNESNMDFDADTLTNLQEFTAGTDPMGGDTDHDGVNDNIDKWPTNPAYGLDTDDDGLPNPWEIQYSLCPSCPGDANDPWFGDGDQLSPLQEFALGTNPTSNNTDGDSLPDNTDKWPTNAAYAMDSDNDGLPNEWEWENGFNSYDAWDANDLMLGDTDKLSPLQEFLLGTDPNQNDTDGDYYDDRHDFDPLVAHMMDEDLDFDGIPRWWEQAFYMSDSNAGDAFNDYDGDNATVLQEFVRGTFPDMHQDVDDDNDGMPNGWEMAHGINPYSYNGNQDYDGDSLTNLQEYFAGTDPYAMDTDTDGMNDDQDKWPTNAAYSIDTDDDGLPDAYEIANPPLDKDDPYDATDVWFGDSDQLSPLQEFAWHQP